MQRTHIQEGSLIYRGSGPTQGCMAVVGWRYHLMGVTAVLSLRWWCHCCGGESLLAVVLCGGSGRRAERGAGR